MAAMLLILLFILFVVAPLVELYVFVQVVQSLGFFESLGLLIVLSIAGAWLVRRTGMVTLARMGSQLASGVVPTDELINGGLVLFSGVLLCAPGFVTDALAFALLLPPVRAVARAGIKKRTQARFASGRVSGFGTRFGKVVDADGRPTWKPTARPPRDELE